MNFKSIIGAAMLLTLSAPLYAVPTIHGNLDPTIDSDIIRETANPIGRVYSQFDAFDLTYDDTVAAVASGGIYDGWFIATTTIALEFIDSALSGLSACTGVAGTTNCGTISGWNDGDFGASFTSTIDYFAYLSNPLDLEEIGFGKFETTGLVTDITLAANPGSLDSLSGANAVNLLLYRNDGGGAGTLSQVPEPGILALLSLGLLGLGVRRFKAKG